MTCRRPPYGFSRIRRELDCVAPLAGSLFLMHTARYPLCGQKESPLGLFPVERQRCPHSVGSSPKGFFVPTACSVHGLDYLLPARESRTGDPGGNGGNARAPVPWVEGVQYPLRLVQGRHMHGELPDGCVRLPLRVGEALTATK